MNIFFPKFSQMLKVNQLEKKQTVLPKYQNGPLSNLKIKENVSKSLLKETKRDPRQKDVANKVKDKTVPPTVGPRDSQINLKVPSVPENRQSAAPKRKKDSGESNGVPAIKTKKTVVENRKPTE